MKSYNVDAPFDALIVGGGVIGLSLAWELAMKRAIIGDSWRIGVIDGAAIGRGASWAGAGILPPAAKRTAHDPLDQLRARSHQLHPQWAQRLRDETGIDTGFQRCGGVYLATTVAEAATLAANRFWWDEHGIEYAAWDARELVAHEPALAKFADRLLAAWFLPDECQLRNPRHLQALAVACMQRGVELMPGRLMEHPLFDNQVVSGVAIRQADGASQVLSAKRVCVCAGAWARQTLDKLGIRTGLMPVRGQMMLYRASSQLLHRVINEGHRYLVPRDDGRILAGSVEEEVGYVIETTNEAISRIGGWAEGVLPQLRECEVERQWAGLRPGSYDGYPYMGPVPGAENLFVAAGHFRSGLHLSCATAEIMAEVMQGETSSLDLYPFRVGR
ncbi:MAG: glycine oxidase ThiO [Pirellulaceae bacterium]